MRGEVRPQHIAASWAEQRLGAQRPLHPTPHSPHPTHPPRAHLVHCLGPSGFSVDAILPALPSHCPFSVALRGSCDCHLQVGIRDCRMAKPCVPNAASILAVWLPVWQTFFPGLRPDCIPTGPLTALQLHPSRSTY